MRSRRQGIIWCALRLTGVVDDDNTARSVLIVILQNQESGKIIKLKFKNYKCIICSSCQIP